MEKRSKILRYQMCFCERHKEIQVGSDMILGFGIFTVTLGIACVVLILTSKLDTVTKLAIIGLFTGGFAGSIQLSYGTFKNKMLTWGHTEPCSKKIARMACVCQAMGGRFKEMDNNNPKENITT